MTTQTINQPPGSTARRREWVGLAVLALPTLLLSLDMSVLYLALPQLSTDLNPSATQQLWIMDSYGFALAGFLITMGTVGDRIGRRRLLLAGAAAFSVASVLAAYSSSAEMLIATRAVMGLAGATLMPSTLALITNMFRDPHQRGIAIGVWMSCFMGGMSVGPLVGGVLLANFWWGSAFLLGVPVMLVLLVAAPLLLPEYRDDTAGRLDLVSVVLSLSTILPVIYALKEIALHGFETSYVIALAAGFCFGYAFVRRQLQLDDPLIDIVLFRNRDFSAALGINLSGGVVMAGTFLLLSLYPADGGRVQPVEGRHVPGPDERRHGGRQQPHSAPRQAVPRVEPDGRRTRHRRGRTADDHPGRQHRQPGCSRGRVHVRCDRDCDSVRARDRFHHGVRAAGEGWFGLGHLRDLRRVRNRARRRHHRQPRRCGLPHGVHGLARRSD